MDSLVQSRLIMGTQIELENTKSKVGRKEINGAGWLGSHLSKASMFLLGAYRHHIIHGTWHRRVR